MSLMHAAGAAGSTGTAGAAAVPAGFDLALTVDDLPVHGALPPGASRIAIAEAFLQALKAHRVPEAYGFVNAGLLQQEPGAAEVLDRWRAAGHPLGNHTHSHGHIDQAASPEAWQADVIAGEAPLLPRMQGADWRWFRFPYLGAAQDPARQAAALAFLQARGYRVADVSLGNDDWAYNDPYARCRARGDTAAVAALERRYLQALDDNLARARALSLRLHGRMVPQVLLLHIGAFTAATLPQLLARLEAAGARYVTLAQAQADAAYAEPGGGGLLERSAQRRGISLDGLPPAAAPVADLAALCR